MENSKLFPSRFKNAPRKPTKKSKQIWRPCDLINYRYMVSSHGKIEYTGDSGLKKMVEPYFKEPHLYVSLYDNELNKKEWMLAELLLYTFRKENYHFGARIKFTDCNPRNVHIDNLRFKIKTEAIKFDLDSSEKWKCSNKANFSNERYKDKTREKITGDEVYAQLLNQYFYCYYCALPLEKDTWQLDHITPVSKGGHNNKSNIACSCKSCNTIKSDLDPTAFFRHIERLFLVMRGEAE